MEKYKKNYESKNYHLNNQRGYGKYIFFLKSLELLFKEVHK
jgi:hypothetical protein